MTSSPQTSASKQPASASTSASTQLATYLQSLQRFGIAPGLERIRALLESAGNPHLEYSVVLVGGTNGKGSTCEFLARLLQAEDKKVGLYTSPHLYNWNERIRVFNAEVKSQNAELFPGAISDAELDTLFRDATPYIEAVAATELGQPTEFEVVTFLGLWHFARQKVDIAVVEVGLGGKWDATNVTQPIVSVITHVALDHCDRLGNTVEEIASDKVHIARSGRVLVTAETKPGVLQVFENYCAKIGCKLQKVEIAQNPTRQDFQETNFQETNFQEINLQTAQAASRVLRESLSWPEDQSPKFQAQDVQVVGRFETIHQNPCIILDGANNPDGAKILAASLRSTLAALRADSPNARLILVLGILLDKDYAVMTGVLAPLADVVIATKSHSPRAANAELVAQEARKFCSRVEQSTPVAAAMQRALEIADKNDIICATGSFYTISEIERESL